MDTNQNASVREVAKALNIGISTANKWMQKVKKNRESKKANSQHNIFCLQTRILKNQGIRVSYILLTFCIYNGSPKQAAMISCLCFRTLKTRCNNTKSEWRTYSMKNAYDLPIVESALAYAQNGWPVFPLHNKRPFEFISPGVKSHGYKDATTDEETILRMVDIPQRRDYWPCYRQRFRCHCPGH